MSTWNTTRTALTALSFITLAAACDSDDASSGTVDAVGDTAGLPDLPGGTDTDPAVGPDTNTDTDTVATTGPDADVAADTTPPADTDTPGDADTSANDTPPLPDATFNDTTDATVSDTTADTLPETSGPDAVADGSGEPGDTHWTDGTDGTDATTVDTSTEVGPDPCGESCLEVGVGPTGVVITNNGTDDAPTLGGLAGGSEPMSGLFELDAITVYTKGAFDGFLIRSATVADNGDTSGTTRFEDGHWAFFLDLDLLFTANTILGPNSGASRNAIQGGGCFIIAANMLESDTSACADGWPSGTTPPEDAEFGYDDSTGRFVLKVILSREFVLAIVPPEYQSLASAAVTGPIRFLATFTPAP